MPDQVLPYDRRTRCPACGTKTATSKYLARGGIDPKTGPFDIIQRCCENCGFTWKELPRNETAAMVMATPSESSLQLEYGQLHKSAQKMGDYTIKVYLAYLAIQGFGVKFMLDAPHSSGTGIGLLVLLLSTDMLAVITAFALVRTTSDVLQRLAVVSDVLELDGGPLLRTATRLRFGTACMVVSILIIAAATVVAFLMH